jgi:hypothetical protein
MAYRRKRPEGKIVLTFSGRTLSVADWATELGWNVDVIYARLRKGWQVDKVLSAEVKHGGSRRPPRLLTHDGRTQEVPAWAAELGISPHTLHNRLARMPVDEALTRRRFARRLYVFQNRAQGLRDWAAEMKIPIKRLERRLRLGWSLEKALTTPRLSRGIHTTGGRRFGTPPRIRRGHGVRPRPP